VPWKEVPQQNLWVKTAKGRPICSGRGKKRPGYDRLAAGRFEFVPPGNQAVFFVSAMRRKQSHPEAVRIYRVEERRSRADAQAIRRSRRRLSKKR